MAPKLARIMILSAGLAALSPAQAQAQSPATNVPPPVTGAGGAPGGISVAVRACPANAQQMRRAADCVCTTVATQASAPVWGVDIYTADSSICRAALHSGAIPAAGGTVRVTLRGAQQSYGTATRNGVTSDGYAAYDQSFSVAASTATSDVGLDQCPASFANERTGAAALSCTCTARLAEEGAVWGSDVYTDDSSICRAARHAGVISAEGGAVRFRTVPGRQSYAGTTRNGVGTQDYGPWDGAFAFDR
jgi:hypothetical protein